MLVLILVCMSVVLLQTGCTDKSYTENEPTDQVNIKGVKDAGEINNSTALDSEDKTNLTGISDSTGEANITEAAQKDTTGTENNVDGNSESLNNNDEEVNNNLDKSKLFYNKPGKVPSQTQIKIFKQDRVLELYGDGELIGRFKSALGTSPVGDKNKEGDRKTPEGKYYVCTRNDKSQFTLFLGISYPNIDDAKRGLEQGLIDQATFDKIKRAIDNKTLPPWKTPLGGEVGIHGGGNSSDWTFGCIAVSDDDIRIIWQYAPLGTPVDIYE